MSPHGQTKKVASELRPGHCRRCDVDIRELVHLRRGLHSHHHLDGQERQVGAMRRDKYIGYGKPSEVTDEAWRAHRRRVSDVQDQWSEDDELKSQMNGMRAVFEKTDRILTGRDITVRFNESPLRDPTSGMPSRGVLAWTDGHEIGLNLDVFRDTLKAVKSSGEGIDSFLPQAMGANYHELAHCLYTPLKTSGIMSKIRSESYYHTDTFFAWNFLEDQRIETLFWSKYRPARHYFVPMILRWVLREGVCDGSWAVTSGRHYMPKEYRDLARGLFVDRYGEDKAKRIEEVVEEYLRTPTSDTEKQFELVKIYRQLLRDLKDELPDSPEHVDGGGVTYQDQPTEEQRESEEDEALDNLDDAEEEAEEYTTGEGGDEPDGSAIQGDEGDTESTPGDEGGTGEEGAGQGMGEDEGQDTPDGTGAGGPTDMTAEEFAEKIEDWLDQVLSDPQAQKELQHIADSIHSEAERLGAGRDDLEQIPFGAYAKNPVTSTMTMTAHKVEKELRKIQIEAEPGRERHRPHGRLNIRDTMHRERGDFDVFDEWDEGKEEDIELEVAILLDVSSSMRDDIGHASRAMWVIKHPLDVLGIPVSVAVFNGQSYTLYDRDRRVHKHEYDNLVSTGSTYPIGAMRAAMRDFDATQAENALMVVITDGEFHSPSEVSAVIDMMAERGTVLLIGLRGAVAFHGSYGFDVARDVKEITEIPPIIAEAVGVIMKRAQGIRT